MREKTWTDQPDAVLDGVVVCDGIRIDDRFAEVRKLTGGKYTLTIGNLFGSETLICDDADCVFSAINVGLSARNRRPVVAPKGCVLAGVAPEKCPVCLDRGTGAGCRRCGMKMEGGQHG